MTRRRTVGTALLWLPPVLGLLLVVLWTGSAAALTALGAVLLLLLGAQAVCLVQARRVSVQVTLAPSAAKNEEICGTLSVAARTRLPIGCAVCTLELRNELTDERDRIELAVPSGETAFAFRAAHCGQVRVRVRTAVLTGLTGLCRARVKTDAAARLTVLPNTFPTEVTVTIDTTRCDDSDEAPDRRGSDLTEPYALREYMAGDSLRQLHRKLSEKLDRPIVREGSAPVSRSLLLLWDKGGTPQSLDAQAEVLFSVGQALGDAGVRFTLGWTTADGLRLTDAASEPTSLFELLALPLRDAAPTEDMLAAALDTTGALSFGKTVCLCAAVSPVLTQLCGAETTVLLCGAASSDCPLPTVCFVPTDYEAALRHLEL